MAADRDATAARTLAGWIPPARNVAALSSAQVRGAGHRPFLTFYDDDTGERTELGYATFDNWVSKTANLLVEEFGVEPGDRVVTVLGSHWTTVVVAFACWKAGACVAPIDADDAPRRLVEALRPTGARLAVVREDLAPDVAGAIQVVAVGNGLGARLTRPVPGALPYGEEVLAFADDYDDPGVGLDTPALLALPAHAGDVPAPVVLTQENLLAAAAAFRDWTGLDTEDRVLWTDGPQRVEGLALGQLGAFLAGAGTVLTRAAPVGATARRIRDERVTWAAPSGPLLSHLSESSGEGLGGLRGLLCPTGAPAALADGVRHRTGLAVLSGHGDARASAAAAFTPPDLDPPTLAWLRGRDGTPVGCPSSVAEVTARAGELCVRGPVVMAGYDGRSDLDAAAFAGGWLHTGAAGGVEEGPDGRLHVFVHGRRI
jgi:uncharacterized protein (TIGR03089 family)